MGCIQEKSAKENKNKPEKTQLLSRAQGVCEIWELLN